MDFRHPRNLFDHYNCYIRYFEVIIQEETYNPRFGLNFVFIVF